MAERRGPGRPKKPTTERATEDLRIRIRPGDKALIESAADLAGLSMSSWSKDRLLRQARQEISDAEGS